MDTDPVDTIMDDVNIDDDDDVIVNNDDNISKSLSEIYL